MWLRFVDQVGLTRWDILGGLIVICGAGLKIRIVDEFDKSFF
jgi:small multidrug resistance family-3 protein